MTTERMIRGMNIEEQCSPEESMSHAADAESSWSDTGFRLVHGDEKQTILGSSIVYNSHVARESDGAKVTASHFARSIGYRLCVDWREQ